MNREHRAVKVGALRPSQLLYTFGIGSIVELPGISAVVMGLDDWDTRSVTEIGEERLLAAVRRFLGHPVERPCTPPPPASSENGLFNPFENAGIGVPVVPFPRWVPAVEVRGEGVFIQFDEAAVARWCDRPEIEQRETEFYTAHRQWRHIRRIPNEEAGFPGIRYVLLHSFAHALMRQLALECGYTAASIRERIYSRRPEDPDGPMAGVLIYTAAPDSEGTLGGLVSLGQPEILASHIARALEQVQLCTSDPLCADHPPHQQGTTLHGAACHACLFAPEPSCERGNRYLDRTLLVRTLGIGSRAFFEY